MDFVTRKVTAGIGKLLRGEISCIEMGNIDSVRDWGHAKDYVLAMWMMLQADEPGDYVVATGETHSVRDFISLAFSMKGLKIRWQGSGLDEVGIDETSGRTLLSINERYFRPLEVDYLEGDSSKARRVLGWTPITSFFDLVSEMVANDTKGC